MPKNMIWHDQRLIGNPPGSMAQNIFSVNNTFELQNAIGWIRTYAQSQGRLDNLFIMCHGFESIVGDDATQVSEQRGGFGLQICRQNINNTNLSAVAPLSGFIARIVIFACATADTANSLRNSPGDGRLFCREFASYTNATIIASDTPQIYHGASATGIINFGAWEGNVYQFTPDGNVRRIDGSSV